MTVFEAEGNEWGSHYRESVDVFELRFTTRWKHPKTGRDVGTNHACLVVTDDIEDAISRCKQRWPDGFRLHQVIKRNAGMHVIVSESVLKGTPDGQPGAGE